MPGPRKKPAPPPEPPARPPAGPPAPGAGWTFLSNHGHVLICLAREPGLRLRDVADRVGITERAVQKIVQDLEDGGILERHKQGRRNAYDISTTVPLRHPVESHRTVGDLLSAVLTDPELRQLGKRRA